MDNNDFKQRAEDLLSKYSQPRNSGYIDGLWPPSSVAVGSVIRLRTEPPDIIPNLWRYQGGGRWEMIDDMLLDIPVKVAKV